MVTSLLGWGVGETIVEILEAILAYIPQAIYFLYACIASVLDVAQSLIRRLAGLDGYYVGTAPKTGTDADPIIEFIYGTLGIGKNASQYSALTTTFWSLAIFGLIVLAVGTMIAIVKAHYQEDSAKTSPVSYIYNAFKAILTFAIVPVAVIIGIQLSQFLLTTLDNITAGTSSSEEVIGIYGQDAVTGSGRGSLKANSSGGYSNYDFFGAGAPVNTTTFSGMLFKASAYNANRARLGSIVVGSEGLENGNGKKFQASLIFGNTSSAGMQNAASSNVDENGNPVDTATSYNAYLAYQIDYAFANNLKLNGVWHIAQVSPKVGSTALGNINPFGLAAGFSSFSKYNVGLVWVFYDLWHFNFIVGFAAVFTIFGMLISIVMGLMSRLIKSVVLFLIYPATLGLASLDDFGAFKKWRTEFQKQILGAFGVIIGMNLLFLVLPYFNNITFYPDTLAYGGLNALVNTVVVITGILMIKSMIEFVSGLVGGANALSEGDGLKSQMTQALKTGIKRTAGAAGLAMNTPVAKMMKKGIQQRIGQSQVKKGLRQGEAGKGKENEQAIVAYNRSRKEKAELDERIDSGNLKDLYKNWRKKGLSDEEARKRIYTSEGTDSFNSDLGQIEAFKARNADKYKKGKKGEFDEDKFEKDMAQYEGMTTQAAVKKQSKLLTSRSKEVAATFYLDDKGEKTKEGQKRLAKDSGKEFAGAFLKNFMEGLGDLKINPGFFKGLLYQGSNKTVDEKGSVTGETIKMTPWKPGQKDDSAKPSLGFRMLSALGSNKATEKKESTDKVQEKAAKDTASSAKKQEESAKKMADEMAAMRRDMKTFISDMKGIVKKP